MNSIVKIAHQFACFGAILSNQDKAIDVLYKCPVVQMVIDQESMGKWITFFNVLSIRKTGDEAQFTISTRITKDGTMVGSMKDPSPTIVIEEGKSLNNLVYMMQLLPVGHGVYKVETFIHSGDDTLSHNSYEIEVSAPVKIMTPKFDFPQPRMSN